MNDTSRAVVIGGSIAGLATAATLSTRVGEVVLVERRTPPRDGSIAPQGALPHVMLAAGAVVLERLFPGFAAALLAGGAESGGDDPQRLPCHWAAAGSVRDHLSLPDTGVPRALCSRALVEQTLRRTTLALPNVRCVPAGVVGLAISGSGRDATVTGVRLRGRGDLEAELVVDASGRATKSPQWLRDRGLEPPRTTEVVVDLRYSGYLVERLPGDVHGAAVVVAQNSADVPRIGVALPREGGCWQVVLGGYFGDAAPVDGAGAVGFARSLSDPTLAELVSRPLLAEPARYTFRSSLWRRWDKVRRLPRGLCAVGDAVASFNPLYGQGMTSALLQAEALGSAYDRHGLDRDLGRAHARAAARIVANPWTTATGSDFIYPRTVGRRPPASTAVNRYVEQVTRAAAVDELVNRAFTEVQQLLAPPAGLFAPRVAAHVWSQRAALTGRGQDAAAEAQVRASID